MSHAIVRTSNIDNISRQVLDTVPLRALSFLRTASTRPAIRSALETVGYTDEDHAEGWTLFFRVSGYAAIMPPLVVTTTRADQVVGEIEAWQRTTFGRARAALKRLHPEQEAFVFNGLASARGNDAIAAITTFLDRIDALLFSAPVLWFYTAWRVMQ